MYQFYVNGILLPVTPASMSLKINNANKTMTLINDGEINMLKTPGLSEIEFDAELPGVQHAASLYTDGFKPADYYLGLFEELKTSKKPFRFIVIRELPNGSSLYDTNMKVSLEEYTVKEKSENGFDAVAGIKLKQYRDYSTKTFAMPVIQTDVPSVQLEDQRPAGENEPAGGTYYTVESGDSLWAIAASFYGDGSRYSEIYEANSDQIESPSLIYPGQVFYIP